MQTMCLYLSHSKFDWRVPLLSLQISEGLSFLHSGVKMVHGNLSPENIILNKSGAWKIMGFDFSISSTNPSDADVSWLLLFPQFSLSGRDFFYWRKWHLYTVLDELCFHILHTSSYVLSLPFSLNTHVKNGSPTSLLSASPTLSTWPLSTSCLSAVIQPLTCIHWVWSCMLSSMRASLFSKSTSTTFLRASAGNWTRWVEV